MEVENFDDHDQKYPPISEETFAMYKKLQTGDILLFHESKSWLSWALEYFGASKYSHVAMVLRDPIFIHPHMQGLYMFEAGIEEIPDSEDKKIKCGVQIVPLNNIVSTYEGEIYVRRLRCDRGIPFYKKLREVHETVHNKPYDFNPEDWLKAYHRLHGEKTSFQQTKSFWCSALLSYIFVELGLLDDSTPWSIVAPQEWGTEKRTDLIFKNCTLKKEEKLK